MDDEQLLQVWLTPKEPAQVEVIDAAQKLVRIRMIPLTEQYNIDDVARYGYADGAWYTGSVVYRRFPKKTVLKIQREDHDRIEHRWEELGCKVERQENATWIAHKEDVDPYAVIYAEGIFIEEAT